VEVGRDKEYIQDLIAEEQKFWNCVVKFESPPLTDADYLEFVNDGEWESLIVEAREIYEFESTLKRRKEENRSALKAKCNGRSARGNGGIFTRSNPKGRVNYDAIPELKDIDLTPFRKPAAEKWTIRFEKETATD
ncbi:unnamed protein product, partial [marine sediment metagenome]